VRGLLLLQIENQKKKPVQSSEGKSASPENKTTEKSSSEKEWDPFSDFDGLSAPTPVQRPQRSQSAAPAPQSAPPSARKPTITKRSHTPNSVPETISEEFDPWGSLDSLDTPSSSTTTTSTSTTSSLFTTSFEPAKPQSLPSTTTKGRSGSVDHFSTLLQVNTSPPTLTVPQAFPGARGRSGSAAPSLSIQPGLPVTETPSLSPSISQSEVFAIQAQLGALQAAQAALSARLGQLGMSFQPVLPITPNNMSNRTTTPDPTAFGIGGGITTPVPFPPAPVVSQSSSGSSSLTSDNPFDDPFSGFT